MEKLPPKPKKIKGATRDDLLLLDKNELVDKILQLEAHNTQLKNIISRNLSDQDKSEENEKKKPFDFSKCHFRRVLIHLLYFGWDYQGLAVQEDTNQTIEHHLFHALQKSCLIESRQKSQYHRSGRTDKGVSAFGQVISITLRSKYPPKEQYLQGNISSEMPYSKILNRLLPKEIRAVAWMPIPAELPEYSARFNCKSRKYKYYFPRSNLDIPAMRQACCHLIGSHDFRHLCKMDVAGGVTEFVRNIFSADITPVDENDCDSPTSMYVLTIVGNAFLWHQIRCIVGVLLLVGQRRENPDVVATLLDVDKLERKPQYNMALDIPLNLFHCSYDLEESQQWIYDKIELRNTIEHIQGEWTVHSIKTTMIKDSLQKLEEIYAKLPPQKDEKMDNPPKKDTKMTEKKEMQLNDDNGRERDVVMAHTKCLTQGVKPKVYVPLLKRVTCSSLEERIEHYKKKRKVDAHTDKEIVLADQAK